MALLYLDFEFLAAALVALAAKEPLETDPVPAFAVALVILAAALVVILVLLIFLIILINTATNLIDLFFVFPDIDVL